LFKSASQKQQVTPFRQIFTPQIATLTKTKRAAEAALFYIIRKPAHSRNVIPAKAGIQ
jgi:hypothetical protein